MNFLLNNMSLLLVTFFCFMYEYINLCLELYYSVCTEERLSLLRVPCYFRLLLFSLKRKSNVFFFNFPLPFYNINNLNNNILQ